MRRDMSRLATWLGIKEVTSVSWKSILYSILSVVLTAALLLADTFLFGIETILGIIGIVLILIVPGVMLRKAKREARGILDKLIALLIAPALILIVGFLTVMSMFVW